MTKIKVCFFSSATYPLFNPTIKASFGGAEVQMYLIGKALQRTGNFELTYVVGDYGQLPIEYVDGIKLMKAIGAYIKKNPNEAFREMLVRKFHKWSIFFMFLGRFIFYNPDVIVTRCASSSMGRVCLWSKMFRSRLVHMIAHEIDCSGEFEKWEPQSAKWYRWGLKNADLVIAQNEQQQKMLVDNYKRSSVIIKSVYEINDFEKQGADYTLWVGRCEDWKRPNLFLDLAAKHLEQKFVMVAPSARHKEDYYLSIKEAASKLHNLVFKDFVPFEDIDDYFKKAKLFVITSKYEGFPNTLIQAAKNKVPTLSLDVNPDDVFGRYDLGFFAKGNFNALERKFEELINDDNLLSKMGDRAFLYARQNHDISLVIRQYQDILTNVINNS